MWPEAGIAVVLVLAATVLAKLGGILTARVWVAWVERRLGRAT